MDFSVREPLAERMRPRCIEEFVGQEHLLAPGKILWRFFQKGEFPSIILWGPAGSGKTTLARLIVKHCNGQFVCFSAVTSGVQEIRRVADEAERMWKTKSLPSWLFIDEIHRLNKAQQDVLLPYVETGLFRLIGATTENPSFEINTPLLSRVHVIILRPLSRENLLTIMERALSDKERGLGLYPVEITEDAKELLIQWSGGDGRRLLNTLEAVVLTTSPDPKKGFRLIDREAVKDTMQKPVIRYDRSGDQHYDLISALHKSIRGSDPDAALYWLSRMLEAGEDPLYIMRRIIQVACEDVGLADPFALVEAVSAFRAYEIMGSPEGDLAIAHAVVYLSLAPKSNSVYKAFGKSRSFAAQTGSFPVPLHLRNAPTDLMKKLGFGKDYKYPHNYPDGWVPESYMPQGWEDTTFYNPTDRGWEGKWSRILSERRKRVKAILNQLRKGDPDASVSSKP
ncbi:MAG: replication-associated recombination protein A [Syntrophobacterales bacterium]|nr:replication-associated recombination protein A [Syntrophobacterales bacterium]